MAAKDLYEKDYYAILGVDKKADAATIPNSSYFFEHLPFTSGLHALLGRCTT